MKPLKVENLYDFSGKYTIANEWRQFFRGALRFVHQSGELLKLHPELKSLAATHATVTKVTSMDVARLYDWCSEAIDVSVGKKLSVSKRYKDSYGSAAKDLAAGLDNLPEYNTEEEVDMCRLDYYAGLDNAKKAAKKSKPAPKKGRK